MKKKVNMIRHEAKSMDAILKPYRSILEELEKIVPVRVIKE